MAVTINASTSTGLVQSADTSGEIELQSNGTTALKVNTNEGIQILNCLGVGNATPSTSGAGITFPATQSASTDANTLDDYEEGTWTPALNRATTSPTVTYNDRGGIYTKIGRLVCVNGYLNLGSNSGGSGTYTITGLPFTVANSNSAYGQLLATDFGGFDFPAGYTGLGGYSNINDTRIYLICNGDNVNSSGANLAVSGTAFIYFTLTYIV